MIKLIPTKTQLELNLERLEAPLTLIENKIASCANDLNESYNALWSLDDSSILEIANHFGAEKVSEIFEAHYQTAESLNYILQSRGITSPVAINTKPKEFVIDPDTGVISFYVEPAPVIVEEPPVEELPVEEPPVEEPPVEEPPVEP